MKLMPTNEEISAAEKTLIDYADSMNRGSAHPGESRTDITEAAEILKRAGLEFEYRWEGGRQVVYINNQPCN